MQKAAHSMRLFVRVSVVELCRAAFRARRMSMVMGSRGLVVVDWLRFMPLTTYCSSVSCVGSVWPCSMWWSRIALRYSFMVGCLTEVDRYAQK